MRLSKSIIPLYSIRYFNRISFQQSLIYLSIKLEKNILLQIKVYQIIKVHKKAVQYTKYNLDAYEISYDNLISEAFTNLPFYECEFRAKDRLDIKIRAATSTSQITTSITF